MISTIIFSFGVSEVFSLLIVSVVIYISQYYYHYFTRPNPLPGPFPLPIIGNYHQSAGLEFKAWLLSLHEKYGDMFEINLAGIRLITLCRTDLMEKMFTPSTKTKYPFKFAISEGFKEIGLDESGLINNTDQKSWKYNRQFFSQSMLTPSFTRQAVEWTSELWKEMETYWCKLEDKELNLVKWMRRFSVEIIFRISTGEKNNAVFSYYSTFMSENSFNEEEKKKIKDSESLLDALEIFAEGMIYFMVFNNFVRHYVPFIRGKVISLLKNRDYLFERVYNVIKKRRIEIENTPLDQPLRHDMLTSFITANTSRDISVVKNTEPDFLRPMTDKEIFGNIFDAIRAATDSTANLFCFAVYHLEHFPEVKNRFRQELDMVFGNDSTRPITTKDMDELQYCEAIIKEVYRHYPIVFMNVRVNVEEDEVGGFNWPEGNTFQIFNAVMMKRKDYWTDPEKFDPDRFYKIEKSDKYLLEKIHAKNSFSMFGGGIRMCPGRRLAMIELKCLLTMFYRKFDFDLMDNNGPLKCQYKHITLCEELFVKVKPKRFSRD